ncbi:YbaB/EbfC family nucleoid-associated protein [Lentzea sp. DG1S-22]|uniref:YbaB/EbfC family nucleoid-associated protein n=1 Tax=unclassified Lentzea TaxID=2643253 RepID=UPI001F3BA5C2|nr:MULTISPECIES: YbaB/EbfC family nucleoid-associated protein [unclassified Lentzea]MCG8926240.1 YbaB/EbfC family nucleoid-associated protein [Lentzea sp. CC55]WVH77514.1 YbaB/EbfC family nucleoid-associated protein [Lentzea sp. DG1S-22]
MTSAELGAGQQRLEEYMRRVGDIQRRAEETQAQLKALRADVSSPDRAVTVRMAPGGRLEKLSLTPAAMRMSHEQLAALITETVGRAHAAVAGQMEATMQPLIGGTSAMDFLRDQVTAAQQPEETEEQQPQQRQRPARPDDDEPFGTIYR